MNPLYTVAVALLFSGAAALSIASITRDVATYWDKAISALLSEPLR